MLDYKNYRMEYVILQCFFIPAKGRSALLTATEDTDVYVTFKEKEEKEKPNYHFSSSISSGRIIYTGPRGGHYYRNKNGNKTYIRRRR